MRLLIIILLVLMVSCCSIQVRKSSPPHKGKINQAKTS